MLTRASSVLALLLLVGGAGGVARANEPCENAQGWLQGPCETRYEDGKRRTSATYERHVLHGAYKSWHPSGQLEVEASYIRGAPDGPYRAYFANGKLRHEATYARGIPTGTWHEYDETGKVRWAMRFGRKAQLLSLEPKPEPTGIGDFEIVLARGSNQEGMDTLTVDGAGRGVMVHRVFLPRVADKKENGMEVGELYFERAYRTYEFPLDAATIKAVRQEIATLGIFALKDEYRDPAQHDGSQWNFSVKDGAKSKAISCSNAFPPELMKLAQLLDERVLGPQDFFRLSAVATDASQRKY